MATQQRPNRRSFLQLDDVSSKTDRNSNGIHIAGLVIHTRPENVDRVRAGLERLSGAEVHVADPQGKLVVTLEAASDGLIADLLNMIPKLPGVIACTLAHHHSEDGEVLHV